MPVDITAFDKGFVIEQIAPLLLLTLISKNTPQFMRVYLNINGDIQYTDDEFKNSLINVADNTFRMHLELLKYKIMWALRSLEKEMDDNNCIIFINAETSADSPNLQIKNCPEELLEKIKLLVASVG